MKKITSKKGLLIYGCSGLGVNMLTLLMGTYLCSALLIGGFDKLDIGYWTYIDKDLVVASLWAVLVFLAKALDGIIDLPFALIIDRITSKFGRRKTGLLVGFIPMIISFALFMLPITPGESIINTVWFGVLLCIFYSFYTLTMLTYYATFAEICETEQDTLFLSNVKSVCDVVYFILGFALVPVFVNMGMNVRIVACIFMPLSLTMLIPFFMLKESGETAYESANKQIKKTKKFKFSLVVKLLGYAIVCGILAFIIYKGHHIITKEILLLGIVIILALAVVVVAKKIASVTKTERAHMLKPVVQKERPDYSNSDQPTVKEAFKYSFMNKKFLYWMLTLSVVTIGLQLFTGGVNELFSSLRLNQTVIMAASFAPVPFTIIAYNKVVKRYGLGVGYRYVLTVFGLGMVVLFGLYMLRLNQQAIFGSMANGTVNLILTIIAVVGGLFISFAIGAFFSVTYTVPTNLAQAEFERTGKSVSGMYFAIQGIFEGIASGIGTGFILVALKDNQVIYLLPVVIIVCTIVGFLMSLKFPKQISQMGKNRGSEE